MCSGTTPSCPPHLGIVLYLLNTSSQQFALMMDSYKQQHRKYTNLANLSADEIKQVWSDVNVTCEYGMVMHLVLSVCLCACVCMSGERQLVTKLKESQRLLTFLPREHMRGRSWES